MGLLTKQTLCFILNAALARDNNMISNDKECSLWSRPECIKIMFHFLPTDIGSFLKDCRQSTSEKKLSKTRQGTEDKPGRNQGTEDKPGRNQVTEDKPGHNQGTAD